MAELKQVLESLELNEQQRANVLKYLQDENAQRTTAQLSSAERIKFYNNYFRG